MEPGKFSGGEPPFIYGAQYYRGPTPGPEHWQRDFALVREVGMTDLKFWVQWRASNPGEEQYRFDDVDSLMDLASAHGIRVTLNIIYDVLPPWLLARHPDCLMVTQRHLPVRPRAYACRQIGGAPGPCLNHPAAREARKAFTRAVVQRYRSHPALFMWDVWNEPEQCTPLREARLANLTCYCPHCHRAFAEWLRLRYNEIARLNDAWGRSYVSWDEAETPLDASAVQDMVDWRLFMLDAMTSEARWRIEMVQRLDEHHAAYLHVVPTVAGTTWGFNQVTCCDDFALAETGDVFGGTINGFPVQPVKAASAAGGKVLYNVESHLRAGSTSAHPAPLTAERLRREFLAQIGLGVRGFLFWQLHAETLGAESPAWGLLGPDGSRTESLEAAVDFARLIAPHVEDILTSPPPTPQAGIFLTAGNEIFQWCLGLLGEYQRNVEGYSRLLYWASVPFAYLPASRITPGGLAGLKVLVLPDAYYMTPAEAKAVADWTRDGGLLIAEAHTAGYNAQTGRHECEMPGCGLVERLGVRETGILARGEGSRPAPELPAEAREALGGELGADRVLLRLAGRGGLAVGVRRCAVLACDDGEVLARYDDDSPAIVRAAVGKGAAIYLGTTVGAELEGASAGVGKVLLAEIRKRVELPRGVRAGEKVHVDELRSAKGVVTRITITADPPGAEITRVEPGKRPRA